MNIKLILFVLLCLSCQTFANDFKSLSCSKKGTNIYYINGIANEEIKHVQPNTRTLNELIADKENRLDSGGSDAVKVDYLYNSSEGFLKDTLQLLGQKLQNGRKP